MKRGPENITAGCNFPRINCPMRQVGKVRRCSLSSVVDESAKHGYPGLVVLSVLPRNTSANKTANNWVLAPSKVVKALACYLPHPRGQLQALFLAQGQYRAQQFTARAERLRCLSYTPLWQEAQQC